MTLEQVAEMLNESGLPVTYFQWPEKQAPPLPYICYRVADSNNFSADGTVYYPINHIYIELYTQTKDTEAEEKLESVLSSLYWEKTEIYIDSE